MTTETTPSTTPSPKPLGGWFDVGFFSSLKLFFFLISLTGIVILIGSWCPQEAQVGRDKVIEQFGEKFGSQLIQYGISDIFHTPFFLGIIGLLSVNLVCASCTRVFPKVKLLRQPMPSLGAPEIDKMPAHQTVRIAGTANGAIETLTKKLRKSGYIVRVADGGTRLTAHWGKFGRLAATVTHIGLLTLLLGVTITSWTGFTGVQTVVLHDEMNFADSQHSRMWVGKLPTWRVRVDATRREDYESGDVKQWYSTLSIVDPTTGKVLKTGEISVNNPLSYDGVDIYQATWGLKAIKVAFNGHDQVLDLNSMGRVHAAVLPLDQQTIMLFSIRDPNQPIRVFAKIPEWPAPRMLTTLPLNETKQLGSVQVTYKELLPATGLQYKSDPGLPITYLAFGFIITGVLMASIPYRQLWASAESSDDAAVLTFGGMSKKAKSAFAKSLEKLAGSFELLDACRDGAPAPSAEEVTEEETCLISK